MNSEPSQYSMEQRPAAEIGTTPRFIKQYRLAVGLASFAMMAGAVVVVVGMAISAYFAYSPVPWVDQWMFLQEFVANHGHYSLALLWKQHGDHRIPLPKLFYLVDLYFFRGRNLFLVLSLFSIQLLHAAWFGIIHKKIGRLSGGIFWTAVALTTTSLFWFTETENFWFGSDLPVILPWLGATIAFSSLAFSKLRLEKGQRGAKRFLLLAWTGALIASLSLTNGLLLWPMLILMIVLWKMPPKMAIATALLGAAFIGFWFIGYTKPATNDASLSHLSLTFGLKLIHYVLILYGYSWAFISDRMGMSLAMAGIVGAIIAYIWLVFWKRGRDIFATVLLSLVMFVVASTLATAFGRVSWGLTQATASRYQTGAMLFWCCLSLLIVEQLSKVNTRRAWLVILAFQFVWLYAFVRAAKLEPMIGYGARIHANSLNAARVALQLGVRDSPSIMYLTIPPNDAQDILLISDFLRLQGWSIFADAPPVPLGRDLKRFYRVVGAEACNGSIASVEGIRDYRWSGFRIRGEAFDLRKVSPAKSVLFVDSQDRIVGRGRLGFPRPGIPPAAAFFTATKKSGFLGYIPADLKVPAIHAFAVLSDGVSACPLNFGKPLQLDLESATYTGLIPTGVTQYLTREIARSLVDFNSVSDAAVPPSSAPISIVPDKNAMIDGCAVDPEKHPGRAIDLVIDDVPLRLASYGDRRANAASALKLSPSTPCGFEGFLPPLPPGQHKITIRVVPKDKDIYYESDALTVIVH